jgi:PAS domain S-box-containing protein
MDNTPVANAAPILVVDDDKSMRQQMCHVMAQAGYRVVEANDGEQALAAYTQFRPSLVLLDAVMPVMDGFICCRHLRNLPDGDLVPILIVTRLDDAESLQLAFDAGATDFIAKPINEIVLQQRVRHLLKASQAMAELRASTDAAQAARQQVTNILESISDAFFALDNEWRFTYINQHAQLLLQKTRSELIGKSIWDEFPAVVGSTFEQQYRQARAQQVAVAFEEFYQPLNTWFAVYAYPARDGLSVYFQNITERKQAEAELQRQNLRSQLFAEIALKIRQSLQLESILQTTVNEIQKFLQADRVIIFRLESDGSGDVVREAVAPGYPAIFGQRIVDP